MGFNSAFKGLKLLKTPGKGRLNNLNDPNRPQSVKYNLWRGDWHNKKQDIIILKLVLSFSTETFIFAN